MPVAVKCNRWRLDNSPPREYLTMEADIDLPAYFERIGYAGPCEPTLAVLADLHSKHPSRIAFEGLDPFLGRPVSIDHQTVQSKLVVSKRGGYCYEQNGLFFGALEAIGFRATPLAARVVWMSASRSTPLTHRLSLVHLPEGDYLADVGFGGQTYTSPLRLDLNAVQATCHGVFRVIEDVGTLEVQMRLLDKWEGMYRFVLTPACQADLEVGNWFTATHPKSVFVRNLIATRIAGASRVNLLNTTLSVHSPNGSEQRQLTSPDELRDALENLIEVPIPADIDEIWRRLPAETAPRWP